MNNQTSKIISICIITLLAVICASIVSLISNERKSLSETTKSEITNNWGSEATFNGAVLCVPAADTASSKCGWVYVLPQRLDVEAKVNSETLHRGIFDVAVYQADVTANGVYNLKKLHDIAKSGALRFDWKNAVVAANYDAVMTASINNQDVELSDEFSLSKIIEDIPSMSELEMSEPENCNLFSHFQGIDHNSRYATVDLSNVATDEISFTLKGKQKGYDRFSVFAIGKENNITISGNSSDPSFANAITDGYDTICGSMPLPSTREVNSKGFTATWNISSNIASEYYCGDLKSSSLNMQYVPEVIDCNMANTEFMIVGGQYTQTNRAIKYAFLVVLLSLTAVFLGELFAKSNMSILNYILIGAALGLFYLMLLSFAEWVGFGWSYLISATLIIGMIGLYLKAVVKHDKTTYTVTGFLALINIFIYILLSIAEMALLLGTIALFILLGMGMYLSLKIKKNNPEAALPPSLQTDDKSKNTNEE